MNTDVKNEMVNELEANINAGDTKAFAEKVVNLVENNAKEIEAKVKADYEALKNEKDAAILAQRGYRDLTSAEKAYYDNMISIAKTKNSTDPSVSHADYTMPETILDDIFAEIEKTHELLAKVDIINCKGKVKWLMNTGKSGTAAWGAIDSAITAQITSGIGYKAMNLHKLSAFMYVSLDMLDLGYAWLHRYSVMCLGEAIADALEDAVINGTGSNQPIGMIKTIAALGETQTVPAVTKSATTITDLSVATLGAIAKTLSNSGKRKVNSMIMVVNPLDAYDKVAPATTIQNAAGEYVRRYAFPLEIVESAAIAQGKAVFGIGKNYKLVVGIGVDGKLEYSDEFKFLDDMRTLKQRVFADGLPRDNNSFVYADISGLQPAYINVKQVEDASI